MNLKQSYQRYLNDNLKIDYSKISHAVDFYASEGFEYIEVPWIVSKKVNTITAPKDVKLFDNFLGCNVASGEQSFLEMILQNKLSPGRYVCCTPCFRDEKTLDNFHFNWFEKVELIDFLGNNKFTEYQINSRLDFMLEKAETFFKKYLDIEVIDTSDGRDIISKKHKIELGSYGIRNYDNFSWVYGTGIAEPRLSQVLSLEKKSYHLKDIPRGEIGKGSKIYEEFLEFNDALLQNNKLMALQELSDVIGAIEMYIETNFKNISLEDLIKMKEATRRAFESGERN
jgi:hypothetical protein